MSQSQTDESSNLKSLHYKTLIENILHDSKKYRFLGHNSVRSAPVTEESSPPKDLSIPIGAYAFLLEELGSWEGIYQKLFKGLDDYEYSTLVENYPELENSCVLQIIPIMEEVDESLIEIGSSKYGGHPDLPDDIEWPLSIDSKHAKFVAQINLQDLRFYHSPKGFLPEKGWLYFFVGSDNAVHSQDMNQPFSFYWNGSKNDLKRREKPEDISIDFVNRLTFDESCEKLELIYTDKFAIYTTDFKLFGHSIYRTYPETTVLLASAGYTFFLENEIETRKRKGVKSLISRYERRGKSEYISPSNISILSQDGNDSDGQNNMFESFHPSALIFKRYNSIYQSRITDLDNNSYLPLFIKDYKKKISEEPTKFWRRTDILTPGQEIQAPKKLLTANFVKQDPVSEWEDQSLPETVSNKDKCFTISSILTHDECADLRICSLPFYTDIQSEYPKEYRNCERALLKSQKLADLLWDRISPYFNSTDFKNVQPYGFDNSGVWKPVEINPCFRFSVYTTDETTGSYFKPHKDAQFVKNDNEKSIFTVLLYLNYVRYGGTTTFLQKVRDEAEDGSEMTFRVVHDQRPEQGSVVIFNHDLYHQGSPVERYEKIILRTEIVFKRVDSLSVPRSDYRNTEDYLKVKQLIEESNDLERKGDTKQALLKYLHALDVQTNISPSLQWSDLSNKSDLERLPEEIIGIVCSFLTSIEVATLMLPLSSLLNSYSRNPAIWKEKYAIEWKDENQEEQVEEQVEETEMICFNDAKQVQCQRNEIIFIEALKEYKDWYALFVSRKSMDKFWSPVLLDPGRSTYRYCLHNSETAGKDLMICGKPNHPHFNLPGFGLEDILSGARAADRVVSYLTKPLPLVDSCGRIEDYKNFKTLIFQLYANDLQVKFQIHPLVLAIPFSWTETEIVAVKKLIYELGIPLSCLVDSSKLIALNYTKPNCIVLNISSSGVGCVPIRNYEPVNELKLFEPFNIAEQELFDIAVRDNIYGVLRTVLTIPQTPPELYETKKEIWEGFVYESEIELEVGGYPRTFDVTRLFDAGNQFYITAFEALRTRIESLNKDNTDNATVEHDVLVCGGFSSALGMKERMTREIREIYPNINLEFKSDDMEVIGGAKIFCSMPNFKELLEVSQL